MNSLLNEVKPMGKINLSKISSNNHFKEPEHYMYVPRQPEQTKQISEEVRQRQFLMHEDFELQKKCHPCSVTERSVSIINEPGDYFYYYNPILTPKQIISQESITGLLSQALSLHEQLVNIVQNKQQWRYQVINKIQQLYRVLGSEMRPSKVVQQVKNSRQGRWETSVTLTTTDLTVKQLSTALLDNYNMQFGQAAQQEGKQNNATMAIEQQHQSQSPDQEKVNNQQQNSMNQTLLSSQRQSPTQKQDEYFKTVIQKLKSDLREESNFERLIFNKLHAKAPEGLQKQPKIIQNVQLKPYQLDGVRFLASVYVNNVSEPKLGKYVPGVCLADDMGLGKTIQTITFLMYVTYQLNNSQNVSSLPGNDGFGLAASRDGALQSFNQRFRQQSLHLIITPLPVSQNWKNEFQRCVSGINVLIYKGDGVVREELRKEVLKPGRNISAIITTYDYVISDHTFFKKIPFDVVVIDEASRIKNCNSKLISVLRNEITCKFRLLLSGTPLQNTLKELFTLLQFIHGQIFNDFNTFEAVFANIINKLQTNGDEESSDADDENSTGNSTGLSCLTSTVSELAMSATSTAGKGEIKPKRGRAKAAVQVELTKEQKLFIIQRLHGIIKPFMIRRVKSDVLDQLPPKDEVLIRCGMSGLQIYLYSMAINETKKMIKYQLTALQEAENASSENATTTSATTATTATNAKNSKNQKKGTKKAADNDATKDFDKVLLPRNYVRNIEIYLRKVCNHPYIAIEPGALERYQMSQMGKFIKQVNSTQQAADFEQQQQSIQKRQRELLQFQYIRDSGKLSTLYVLLKKLKAAGHKVLIFSQFKQMLTVLEQFMVWAGHQYLRFDGDVKDEVRNQLVAQFNGEPGIFVFLLSTRAASHGLNLQAADTVIIYDSDYNAFYDLQAQDRCYRIGQTRPVRVFRFATNCVIEQRLLQIAAHKFSLSQAVIDAGGFDQNTVDQNNDMQYGNDQTGSNGNNDRHLDSKDQLINCLASHNFIQHDVQEDDLIGGAINKKIARTAQEQRIFQQVDDEIIKEMTMLGVDNPLNMVDMSNPDITSNQPNEQYNDQQIPNGEYDNPQDNFDMLQTYSGDQQINPNVQSLESLMQQNFQSQLASLNQIDNQGTNQYGFLVSQKKRGRRPLTEEEKKQQREKIIIRGKTVQHFINNEVYFAILDCLKNKELYMYLQLNPFQFVKDFKTAFKKSQSMKTNLYEAIANGYKYNVQFSKQYDIEQNKNNSEDDNQQQTGQGLIKSQQQYMQLYCDFVHAGFSDLLAQRNASQQMDSLDNIPGNHNMKKQLVSQINDKTSNDVKEDVQQLDQNIQQRQQYITQCNDIRKIFKSRQETLRQRYFYMYEDVFEPIAMWADTDKLIDYSQIILYQILSSSDCTSIKWVIDDLCENLERKISVEDFGVRYVKFVQQRELLEIHCQQNISDNQLKELLGLNELILVHLHIINAYGMDDDRYNYMNVDISSGQVFEELLFYPAIYFHCLPDKPELRQKFKEIPELKDGLLSLNYLHFKAKTLQYQSSDDYLTELTTLLNAYEQIYRDQLIGYAAQELLKVAQKTSTLFTKGYKFTTEQIIAVSQSERGMENDILKFGSGHYGGTFLEIIAYFLFRESKIKRVKKMKGNNDLGDSFDYDDKLLQSQTDTHRGKRVRF